MNAFDRGATWNWSQDWDDVSDWARDGLAVAAGVVTFVPVVLDGRWFEAATLGVIFAETAAFTLGVTNLTKVATRRERPYLYNDGLSLGDRLDEAGDTGEGSLSFFSGHTSLSFAAATLLSTTYADLHGRGPSRPSSGPRAWVPRPSSLSPGWSPASTSRPTSWWGRS